MRVPGGNFSKPALVLCQKGPIGLGMPEMDHAGCKQAVLATHAGVQETRNDIGILLAPATIVGVETVDAIKIRSPYGEVARPRALPHSLSEPAQRAKRQIQQRRQPIDAAAETLREPAHGAPGLGNEVFPQHFGSQFSRKQNPIAGHEPLRLSQAAVGCDKIRTYHAIAVQKNAICSARGQYGTVANFRRAEAFITVPDVLETVPDCGLPSLDQRCRSRA